MTTEWYKNCSQSIGLDHSRSILGNISEILWSFGKAKVHAFQPRLIEFTLSGKSMNINVFNDPWHDFKIANHS